MVNFSFLISNKLKQSLADFFSAKVVKLKHNAMKKTKIYVNVVLYV